jgi:hypothetical protein
MKVNDGFDRANKIMYDLWKRALWEGSEIWHLW